MRILDLIPENETWSIIDQSKLTTFMSCPRKYFYEYILGWRSETSNNHLIFGTAWHKAVEELLLGHYSKEALQKASYLFMEEYRKEFNVESDELYTPKDPKNALISLTKYAERFFRDTKEYEILFTEIGGLVYIAPDEPMTFKMDVIARNRETGLISLWDHKTSQRRMGNWQEQWVMNTQMMLYLHALYCMYGLENVKGAKVRCSFFYKSKPTEFEETMVEKSPDQMQNILTSIFAYYAQLKGEMKLLLEEESTGEENLSAFPMNPISCFNYGKQCLYFDLCNAWANPLQHIQNPPLGMKIEFWNPLEDKLLKKFFDLKPSTEMVEEREKE